MNTIRNFKRYRPVFKVTQNFFFRCPGDKRSKRRGSDGSWRHYLGTGRLFVVSSLLSKARRKKNVKLEMERDWFFFFVFLSFSPLFLAAWCRENATKA